VVQKAGLQALSWFHTVPATYRDDGLAYSGFLVHRYSRSPKTKTASRSDVEGLADWLHSLFDLALAD
jgi:hypothetical protein